MQRPGASGLVEFSFESSAAAGLPAAVFLRLARQSSLHNIRIGLTGRLVFDGARFVAAIEGPCEAVLPLAARILADPRHFAIRTTAFQTLVARRYADWSVGGFDLEGAEGALAENLRPVPATLRRRRETSTASIHSLGSQAV
jgi:hypothetical protein